MGVRASREVLHARATTIDPALTLDLIFSQSHQSDECLLYQLADLKGGGELVDAYKMGGGIEIKRIFKDHFSFFMYNEGLGKEITNTEYLKWKLRGNIVDQKALADESKNSKHSSRFDPLNYWKDHQACWKMEYRGDLGETLLHVLITCNSRIHTRIARLLLATYPCLCIDQVEGSEYLGASALHLAIAYGNISLVKDLLSHGACVHQKARGSLFLPKDQQAESPPQTTDYEGLAYMGETPLNWAACCKNESAYNLLIDYGADPDLQDSYGNMVLHMIVIGDKQGEGQSEEMFAYVIRHPGRSATDGICNCAGLTPLSLACYLARSEIFREMLELTCVEFWRYSNHTCSAYPLNALDTIGQDGKTNWNSALMIILNGKKDEHLNMLEGGIIQRLLEEKWQTFARSVFLRKLLLMMMYLIVISTSLYLRPDVSQPLFSSVEHVDIVRYTFEMLVICGALYYVVIQSGGEIRNQGLLPFSIQLLHDPIQLTFNMANFLILIVVPLRLTGHRTAEELLLTLAIPCTWFYLMFLAGAVQLTGPFVTMIFKIITNDMVTFFIIYGVFLLGFSQAFHLLYTNHPDLMETKFNTYITTWMALFQMTLGDYDYGELTSSNYVWLTLVVFVLFMVLMPILMLNMLIAMMANTYATVVQQSEKEWLKQWANIVITLERNIPNESCKQHLESYSLALPAGDGQRGIVVIKTKSKTKASQRKGALINWKRVGKVTLKALRRRRITGEQLRKRMWDLDSVDSSPSNLRKHTRVHLRNGASSCADVYTNGTEADHLMSQQTADYSEVSSNEFPYLTFIQNITNNSVVSYCSKSQPLASSTSCNVDQPYTQSSYSSVIQNQVIATHTSLSPAAQILNVSSLNIPSTIIYEHEVNKAISSNRSKNTIRSDENWQKSSQHSYCVEMSSSQTMNLVDAEPVSVSTGLPFTNTLQSQRPTISLTYHTSDSSSSAQYGRLCKMSETTSSSKTPPYTISSQRISRFRLLDRKSNKIHDQKSIQLDV